MRELQEGVGRGVGRRVGRAVGRGVYVGSAWVRSSIRWDMCRMGGKDERDLGAREGSLKRKAWGKGVGGRDRRGRGVGLKCGLCAS